MVALLQALPEDRLENVLSGLGIAPERREKAKDERRCSICSFGYVRCRAADVNGDHEWTPYVPGQRA